MDVWITLPATLAGGALAIAGQLVTRRSEGKARRIDLIVEQCSQLVALSQDYRNRLWEERVLGLTGRTAAWDHERFRLAVAQVRILCDDEGVIAALDEVEAAGKSVGAYWRRGETDEQELDLRYERYKVAAGRFVAAAGLVRRRVGRA